MRGCFPSDPRTFSVRSTSTLPQVEIFISWVPGLHLLPGKPDLAMQTSASLLIVPSGHFLPFPGYRTCNLSLHAGEYNHWATRARYQCWYRVRVAQWLILHHTYRPMHTDHTQIHTCIHIHTCMHACMHTYLIQSDHVYIIYKHTKIHT